MHEPLHHELKQRRALTPLLSQIAELQGWYPYSWADADNEHLTPAVYLPLHQWRAILEAFQ